MQIGAIEVCPKAAIFSATQTSTNFSNFTCQTINETLKTQRQENNNIKVIMRQYITYETDGVWVE
jgi:uncharacterized protein YcfJ